MTKIDFVLPWVNGNDPKWQKSKNKYQNTITGEHNAAARYRDMGTLKFVLRSIEKNCPWYNKIHIITCGHHPEWLNVKHEKINIITHHDLYYKKNHLPVFSSSSIEMNLPNLQGVSEQFIYLNDDMIILKKQKPIRFFQHGKPVDFLSHGWLPRNKLFAKLKGVNTWIHSINNNIDLINKHFSLLNLSQETLYHHSYDRSNKISNYLLQKVYRKYIWIEHWHHPQPYLMTTLKKVHNVFSDKMMTCSENKFRKNNDLTQYLYRYWMLSEQSFIPYKHKDGVVVNINSDKKLKNLLLHLNDNSNQVSFACFNDADGASHAEYEKIERRLAQYLNKKFTDPASFEL